MFNSSSPTPATLFIVRWRKKFYCDSTQQARKVGQHIAVRPGGHLIRKTSDCLSCSPRWGNVENKLGSHLRAEGLLSLRNKGDFNCIIYEFTQSDNDCKVGELKPERPKYRYLSQIARPGVVELNGILSDLMPCRRKLMDQENESNGHSGYHNHAKVLAF